MQSLSLETSMSKKKSTDYFISILVLSSFLSAARGGAKGVGGWRGEWEGREASSDSEVVEISEGRLIGSEEGRGGQHPENDVVMSGLTNDY